MLQYIELVQNIVEYLYKQNPREALTVSVNVRSRELSRDTSKRVVFDCYTRNITIPKGFHTIPTCYDVARDLDDFICNQAAFHECDVSFTVQANGVTITSNVVDYEMET